MRGYSSLLILEELLKTIARLETGKEEYNERASSGEVLKVRCSRTLALISGTRNSVKRFFSYLYAACLCQPSRPCVAIVKLMSLIILTQSSVLAPAQ